MRPGCGHPSNFPPIPGMPVPPFEWCGKKNCVLSADVLREPPVTSNTWARPIRMDSGVVMARQVITTLIDDLDGKKADRTVEFSLDGINYTIDLSEANAGKLRKALDPFINAGTRLGRSGRIPARRTAPSRTASSRDENRLIREWALANGHQISERGRIPQSVTDAYRAAN